MASSFQPTGGAVLSPARPSVWDRWLTIAVGAVAAFGLAMIVVRAPIMATFDRLFFGSAESPVPDGPAADYLAFVYGLTGAVMVGWMVALLPIVRGPLRRREHWAWTTIAASVGTWFVVDSLFSLVTGFAENVASNAGFLLVFAVPLVAMRSELVDASP
jgi:hypothetical protein